MSIKPTIKKQKIKSCFQYVNCGKISSEKNRGGEMVKETLKRMQNTPFLKLPFGGINADFLRFTAVIFMLLDHSWTAFIPGNNWLNYLGRMAFPIFAFQISEGFIHTSDIKKYFLRLLVFALVSEIPFNVFCASEIFFPHYQNILFTFLLSIVALEIVKTVKKDPTVLKVTMGFIGVAIVVISAEILKVDYGAAGVVTVLAFYLFRDFPCAFLAQFATLFFVFVFLYPGRPVLFGFRGEIYSFPVQIFSLFSLIFIWLYNGKKGKKNKALQYGFYAFYPLHIALLCVVRFVLNNV